MMVIEWVFFFCKRFHNLGYQILNLHHNKMENLFVCIMEDFFFIIILFPNNWLLSFIVLLNIVNAIYNVYWPPGTIFINFNEIIKNTQIRLKFLEWIHLISSMNFCIVGDLNLTMCHSHLKQGVQVLRKSEKISYLNE